MKSHISRYSFGHLLRFPQVLLGFVGPTAVIAAGAMGSGSTASLVLAGAWFRYDLLWVVILTLPSFVIGLDSVARIGVLGRGVGFLSLIRERIHPAFTWFLLLLMTLVHLFVAMGQMSVMTSSGLALAGLHPPPAGDASGYGEFYQQAEMILALVLGGFLIWLLSRGGYRLAQRWITALLVLMVICFVLVALRGFQEWRAILAGLLPHIPGDLPVPARQEVREAYTSIAAIAGGTLAPASLFGYAYLSADSGNRVEDFNREFRKAILHLGVIFGLYSVLVLVAGGYALFPLGSHAEISEVHEAGQVLTRALPASVSWLAPKVFAAGLFMAALTTFVVIAQVMTYFFLDTFGRDWSYRPGNRTFQWVLSTWLALTSILAPWWTFPALLKIILLMGLNILVVPLATVIILYFINESRLMGGYRAGFWRNFWLLVSLALSLWLAINQVPRYWDLLSW